MGEIDTIAAIATPLGTGGIGIVRISGPDAFGTAERIVRLAKGGGFPHSRAIPAPMVWPLIRRDRLTK